jgi:hypothetical protein
MPRPSSSRGSRLYVSGLETLTLTRVGRDIFII